MRLLWPEHQQAVEILEDLAVLVRDVMQEPMLTLGTWHQALNSFIWLSQRHVGRGGDSPEANLIRLASSVKLFVLRSTGHDVFSVPDESTIQVTSLADRIVVAHVAFLESL